MNETPLVDVVWLDAHQHDPDVVVADVRWYLSGPRGADVYEGGHIPGAHFVDVDTDLSSPKGPGRPGRHPLPTAEAFAATMSRIGVTASSRVIAYDDSGGATAARLWWLLRYFGLNNGSVLNGGLQAWQKSGFALAKGRIDSKPAPIMKLSANPAMVLSKEQVKALSAGGDALILDARAPERFRGEVEPVDARPGHIPGARSAPFAGNLEHPGGRFLAPEALTERYEKLGVDPRKPVVAYCGSGVTACHDLMALFLSGRGDALLYEGSWSEWAQDSALEAATGVG